MPIQIYNFFFVHKVHTLTTYELVIGGGYRITTTMANIKLNHSNVSTYEE